MIFVLLDILSGNSILLAINYAMVINKKASKIYKFCVYKFLIKICWNCFCFFYIFIPRNY